MGKMTLEDVKNHSRINLKKVLRLALASSKNVIVSHQVFFSWFIIAMSILLFFIPYMIPGNTERSLGAYAALSAIPVVLASLLQHRKGSIVVTSIILIGLGVFNTVKDGFPWPLHIFTGWITGGFGILVFGLTIGQFSYMRNKIAIINRQLSITHDELMASHEELSETHDELKMMEEELRANNNALTEANEQLTELALKDSLTRVFNHRAVIESLDREFAFSARHSCPSAILFFDLDYFKVLNDTYGHPVGDAILMEFAHVIQQELRQEDVLGRWGGEEFLAILPETSSKNAIEIANRLCSEVASHVFRDGIKITCSIGVSVFPDHGENREAILVAADIALYSAKKLGRNRACLISDPEVKELESYSKEAKSHEEIEIYGTLKALSELLEARDGYTGAHTTSVSKLSSKIARIMGMSSSEAHMVEIAGQLHDIGKIGIPDAILRKPGKLTDEEWEVMYLHPEIGAQIIDNIPAFKACISAIHSHHERWDGTGYPDQLKGEEIPLGARIIAVVDAYDAIVTDRPYHQAQPPTWALQEIWRCIGTQFDPDIVQALSEVLAQEDENELVHHAA